MRRIYIASLSAYNAGNLIGRWCDPCDADEVAEVCASLPGEECAVHDHEDLPGFRGESVHDACELAEWLAECEDNGIPSNAAALWAANLGERPDVAAVADAYRGEFDNAEEYVEDAFIDGGTEIPESLAAYIDWESMARDWELGGDIVTFPASFGRVFVFAGNG